MMRSLFNNKRNIIITICIIVTSLIYIISGIGNADEGVTPIPGSKDDPIIVESYLTKEVIPQINNYINEKIMSLEQKTVFSVITIEKGKKLICGEGTELILRMGQAEALASDLGGLSDVTQGKDISANEKIPHDHLLIVPRNDGRGIEALEEILVMVKGSYEIQ